MRINEFVSLVRGWFSMKPDPVRAPGINVGALQKRAIERVLMGAGMSRKQALHVLAKILEVLKNERT